MSFPETIHCLKANRESILTGVLYEQILVKDQHIYLYSSKL